MFNKLTSVIERAMELLAGATCLALAGMCIYVLYSIYTH